MLKPLLQRATGGTIAATLAISLTAASAATIIRPDMRVAHPNAKVPGLVTITSEGGTLAAIVYRGWMDYWGVAVPGDSQGAPGGNPLDATTQLLYGAVGTGSAQNDIANQQGGWNDGTPSVPPNDAG
jgi:hypothetical protein